MADPTAIDEDLHERSIPELMKSLANETMMLVPQEIERAKTELAFGLAFGTHRCRGVRRHRVRPRAIRQERMATRNTPHPTNNANLERGHRMGKDSREIRQEIEETRERMGDTIEALGYKTD